MVGGKGFLAGRALGLHPDADVLASTGSTAVGRHFLRRAADSTSSGSGSNSAVSLPASSSRLLVHSSIAEQVTDAIVARAREPVVGEPLEPATERGATAGESHLERGLCRIGTGLGQGARLRVGGGRAPAETGGSFPRPTVFDHVRPGMRLAREEISDPVLSVLTFADLDEAVALADDTEYGLAAGLWTSDLSTAHQVARALRAGTVRITCYGEGDLTVSVGGEEQSGNGRDKSRRPARCATPSRWAPAR